jgi:death-on-curing protein
MRSLTLGEVIELHRRVLAATGGAAGIRDLSLLESALAQPAATFAGQELHPSLIAKAAALAFSLVANHPFVDGNKRIGHATIEVS